MAWTIWSDACLLDQITYVIFIGYLESDNVRVAMTTHEDHQQLTILSPRFTETKSNENNNEIMDRSHLSQNDTAF